MKKTLKILGITIGSLLGLIIIVASIAIWIVFTPERLTPIANKYLGKMLSCEYQLNSAELTFFSTFPYFCVDINEFALYNSKTSSSSDTLLSVPKVRASIDLMSLVKENEIIVDEAFLMDGYANLYTDSLGKTNYDVIALASSDEESDTTSSFSLPNLDIKSFYIKNLSIDYCDRSAGIEASLEKLNLKVFADLSSVGGKGVLEFNTFVKSAILSGEEYLNNQELSFRLPLNLQLQDNLLLTLEDANITLDDFLIGITGTALQEGDGYVLDMKLVMDRWNIDSLMTIVPKPIIAMIDGMSASGKLSMDAMVKGKYDSNLFPKILANISLENVTYSNAELPYDFEKIYCEAMASIDLSKDSISSLKLERLNAKMDDSYFSISGDVDDLMGEMISSLTLNGSVDIVNVLPFLSDSLNVVAEGILSPKMKIKFDKNQLDKGDYFGMDIKGDLGLKNLDLIYDDTLFVRSPKMDVSLFTIKNTKKINAIASSHELDFTYGSGIAAQMKDPYIKIVSSDVLDTTKHLVADINFNFSNITAYYNDMELALSKPYGLASVDKFGDKMDLKLLYGNKKLYLKDANSIDLNTDKLELGLSANYDSSKDKFLAKWSPSVDVDFNNALLKYNGIKSDISIPSIKFSVDKDSVIIEKGDVLMADSDFSLSGKVYNIEQYLDKKDLLIANLDFTSNYTDVEKLLAAFSGMGSEGEIEEEEEKTNLEDNPFMVPLGVNIALNTKIKKAIFNNNDIENIKGKITVNDGKLILEQVGFTSDAAKMQLTAMYRSPRKNHLFIGMDFHLMDIKIDKLIDMVPDIDTLVPMLKSFQGEAEFHVAAETYLKSNYDMKISTLRGAAALEGANLVVLDSDTFNQISKLLMFEKKSKNVIDSLSVEMTVFKDEVDLYPFLISMDKYQAIISGRHNLDMSFNYHIDCALPVRLGLDIKGNMDDMKFKLVPTKYKNLFIPEKRNDMQERTLKLKRLISDSLKSAVK